MNAPTTPVRSDLRPHRSRDERRQVALKGWMVRSSDNSIWDFILTDLSYGGCRLETAAPLRRGEEVKLSVANRGTIESVVRWRREQAVGLSFTAATEEGQQPRQVERLKTDLEVVVRRQGRRSQPLDARDVSPLGCCLVFVDVPRVDDRIWIQLPGLEAIEAKVRWVEGHCAGVMFEKPIHAAVFDLLLERWQG
jgi:hypothetical protein